VQVISEKQISYSNIWSKAVLLDEKALNDAITAMAGFGDQVEVKVRSSDNIVVTHTKVTDCSEIKNTKASRLESIAITAQDKTDLSNYVQDRFSVEFKNSSYSTFSATGGGSLDDVQRFMQVTNELRTNVTPWYSWFSVHTSLLAWIIIFGPVLVFVFYVDLYGLSSDPDTKQDEVNETYAVLFFAGLFLATIIAEKMLKLLFPRVLFSLGQRGELKVIYRSFHIAFVTALLLPLAWRLLA